MDTQQPISLKEAAKISGYSPDYIGQLIRAGKIKGNQVYCNVAWMTTEQAVREYLELRANTHQDERQQRVIALFRRLKLGLRDERAMRGIFVIFLYIACAIAGIFLLFELYAIAVNVDKAIERHAVERAQRIQAE